MGTIKLELDIPNFERELKIEITVRRDGEVVYSASPSPKTETNSVSDNIVEKKSDAETTTKRKKSSGNFMELDNI